MRRMRSNKAAQMAESVDALVSNTSGATRAGSTPALGTKPESSSEGSGFFFVSFVRTIGAKAHGGEQWGRALPSSHARLLRPLWGRRLNRRALHGLWAKRMGAKSPDFACAKKETFKKNAFFAYASSGELTPIVHPIVRFIVHPIQGFHPRLPFFIPPVCHPVF